MDKSYLKPDDGEKDITVEGSATNEVDTEQKNSDSNDGKKEKKEKKENKHIFLKAVILLILIIILLLLSLKACENFNRDPATTSNSFELDDSANEIKPGMTDDEIREILNRKVKEGMINISMNLTPVFEDGTSKGNLSITNESINNYPQIVYIVRNDTKEEIYRSKGIPVGSEIEEAQLDVDLDKGTYECTAYFNNVDPNTGNFLGTAAANVRITVLN